MAKMRPYKRPMRVIFNRPEDQKRWDTAGNGFPMVATHWKHYNHGNCTYVLMACEEFQEGPWKGEARRWICFDRKNVTLKPVV